MICRPNNQPESGQDIDAMMLWISDTTPVRLGIKYAVKHTTRSVRAMVTDLHYRLDVNTLSRDEGAKQLGLNEIGRVRLRTASPLFFDAYRRNRSTGSFIIVEEGSNATVGAGMIVGAAA